MSVFKNWWLHPQYIYILYRYSGENDDQPWNGVQAIRPFNGDVLKIPADTNQFFTGCFYENVPSIYKKDRKSLTQRFTQ